MRKLAVIPFLAFVAAAVHYLGMGAPSGLLWICNVSSLMLALGLVGKQPIAIWTATIWLILGTPLWIYDLAIGGGLNVHSVLTHVGGIAVGLWAICHLPAPRRVWPWGVLFGLLLWGVCRVVTTAEANVNTAFGEYASSAIYPSYFVYFLVSYTGLSFAFWAVEFGIRRIYPCRHDGVRSEV